MRELDLPSRTGAQCGERRRAEPPCEVEARVLRSVERLDRIAGIATLGHRPEQRAALADDAVKQSLGQRGRHQQRAADRAGRLAEDRYIAGVAAEYRDIALNPLQRGDLIEQSIITGKAGLLCELGMSQET